LLFINKSTEQGANTTTDREILRVSVLLRREHKEIHDALGVAPFVVVPCDKLDKVFVQLDASFGIKDTGCLVANKVRRNDRVFRIIDNALKGTTRGIFDCLLDLIIGCFFLGAYNKINN